MKKIVIVALMVMLGATRVLAGGMDAPKMEPEVMAPMSPATVDPVTTMDQDMHDSAPPEELMSEPAKDKTFLQRFGLPILLIILLGAAAAGG